MRSDLVRFLAVSFARLVAALVAALALALAVAPLRAQIPAASTTGGTQLHDVAASFRLSTLGIGLEASKELAEKFSARVGFNYFRHNFTQSQNDVRYDGFLRVQSVSVIGDYYPWLTRSFHLSAGVLINSTTMNATGVPESDGYFTINRHRYTNAQVGTLHGSATIPTAAPYIGVGFGRPVRSGSAWQLLADVGAAFMKPTLTFTATQSGTTPGLATDLAAEQAESQHDVNKYIPVFPVISFGLSYRW